MAIEINHPTAFRLLKGKPKEVGEADAKNPLDRKWTSSIFKKTTDKTVFLTETGLVGDEVADKKAHGGPEKAVFAYPTKHYEYWQEDLANDSIGIGAMGENIALINGDEDTFCIGDTFKFGEAVIEVSQPRQPCWKPARRFRVLDFALRIQNTGKTGWYFRVLKEGNVKANDPLILIDRPNPQWTISKCNEVMHVDKKNFAAAKELAELDTLAVNWKRTLNKRLAGQESVLAKRVYGPNKEEN